MLYQHRFTMTSLPRCLLIFSFLLLTLPAGADAGESPHVGVAETDITPSQGFLMAGYYHERKATGTIDPLKAKAIVFRSGKQQAAIVVCDLTGIAVDLSAEVRRRAWAKTGIPVNHIVVSATHSHTAPDYTRDLYDHLRGKNGETGKSRYAVKLIDGIVEAITKAHSAAKPVVLECGSARQETPVSFNRRFVMKDGSVKTWMRLDNPDVVRPAGPIDPEIGMVLLRAANSKKPVGLFSSFALHLDTVGGTQWSADYPYFIGKEVEKALGSDVISIFGTGCCGDINHVDPVRKDRNKTDFIGGALGKTVTSSVAKLRSAKHAELRVRHTTVKLPLQKVSTEQLAKARPMLLEAREGKKVEFFDFESSLRHCPISSGCLSDFSTRQPCSALASLNSRNCVQLHPAPHLHGFRHWNSHDCRSKGDHHVRPKTTAASRPGPIVARRTG